MLLKGDCLEMLKSLPDNSVDSIVTDPPYGLGFMGVKWDTYANESSREKSTKQHTFDHVGGNHNPTSAADAARTRQVENERFGRWSELWATECLRVLKPGGYLLAFGGSRTYHRLASAVEDAGFEIRDQIMWIYGSGFPKSMNVSKSIDKAAGAEREVVGMSATKSGIADGNAGPQSRDVDFAWANGKAVAAHYPITAPPTPEAQQWGGWGTALKPAHEPIVVARKPLIGTVAANVLGWGTGALNIDASRIRVSDESYARNCSGDRGHSGTRGSDKEGATNIHAGGGSASEGRFPANVIHDGSDEVVDGFPNTKSGKPGVRHGGNSGSAYGAESRKPGTQMGGFGDEGSAARFFKSVTFDNDDARSFFYCAKASRSERNAGLDDRNGHPTIKPLALMRYLIKLVTPPGGVVLDPFLGSGTTAVAAILEGFDWIGCEKTEEYFIIIEGRVQWAEEQMQPSEEIA